MGFLVLTRRPGESILIGDDIEVALLAVKDGRAELSISGGEPGAAVWLARGDEMIIRPGIEVHVSKLIGDKARIAVKAPASVKIWRSEVVAAVREEREAA